MGKIILYHGTPNKIVTPIFGGERKSMIMEKAFI